MPIGYYLTSGFSTDFTTICANMQYSLSGSATLSAAALTEYNKDISLGKIAIRIPIESAYPFNGQLIYLGYDSINDPPELSTFKILGSFQTKTSSDILLDGEYIPLIYTSAMFLNQYEYFENPAKIYAYTNELFKSVSGNVNTSGGVDFGPLLSFPTGPTSAYNWLGSFETRFFYDKINYFNIETSSFILDGTNDYNNPLNIILSNNSILQIKYISGDLDYNGILNTFYAVSGNNNVINYTDKNEIIQMIKSDNTLNNVNIYTVLSGCTNSMLLQYSIEEI